jgi:hypothetical protein
LVNLSTSPALVLPILRASGLTAAGDFLSGFELFFRRERLRSRFSRSFAPKEGLQFRFPNAYGSKRVSFRDSKSSFTVKDREFDFPDLLLRKKPAVRIIQ